MSERVSYDELSKARAAMQEAYREYRRALAAYERLERQSAEEFRELVRRAEARSSAFDDGWSP